MSKFFVWSALRNWKPTDIPMNGFVSICLVETMTMESGEIALTSNLASAMEIDFAVDALIADLEQVRRKAKDRLGMDNAKVRTAVVNRAAGK